MSKSKLSRHKTKKSSRTNSVLKKVYSGLKKLRKQIIKSFNKLVGSKSKRRSKRKNRKN